MRYQQPPGKYWVIKVPEVEMECHFEYCHKPIDRYGVDSGRSRDEEVMNLRRDPFERAHNESDFYNGWWVNRMFFLEPAQTYLCEWLQSFKDFPLRQKPAAFNLDPVLTQMERAGSR